MYRYAVGERYEDLVSREGIRFDMSDEGGTLMIYFNRPTDAEIRAVKRGPVQFKLLEMKGIIFLLTKFEGMEWMDSPYHVALSKNLTELRDLQENQGYALHIILVDGTVGEIKAMRLVGLGYNFSSKFRKLTNKQKETEFRETNYNSNLFYVMTNYTTKDLLKYSEISCRIEGRLTDEE